MDNEEESYIKLNDDSAQDSEHEEREEVPKSERLKHKKKKKKPDKQKKEEKWKQEKTSKEEEEGDDESNPFPGPAPVDEKKVQKYRRGDARKASKLNKEENFGRYTSHKFRSKNRNYEYASEQAARSELLLTENTGYLEADEGEHTSEFRQADIAREVDISSAQKYFELHLKQFGPYRINYTRNGRHLLLGGGKGHIAAFDWQTKKLMCEMNVMETCYDVKWLHIETMFAVAQKQWVYIYDNQGLELHCLKNLHQVLRMEFLPYHFLLAGANAKGFLRWIDTSIGADVAGFPTNQGRCDVMCQNPRNAIIHLGHARGTVTLWSPNVRKPLVKMLCHRGGGVRSLCVDSTGNYMATSGLDAQIKIWDLRQFRELNSCRIGHGAASLSFSQTGLLAAGIGGIVEVYADPRQVPITEPYLRHHCTSTVQSVQFCPYEDVLGAGVIDGFASVLVPGAGEANFDALEANPYQTVKQRQNAEVKMLLDKIQPEMITLDTSVLGKVNQETAAEEYQKQVDAFLIKPRKVEFPDTRNIANTKKSAKLLRSKKGARDAAMRDKRVHQVQNRQKHARSQQFNEKRHFSDDVTKSAVGDKKRKKDAQYTGVFERFKRKDD